MSDKKTENAAGGRRAAIVLLTIGLPVLAGLALIYTSYVSGHRQHIVTRDYRVLGTAGRQLAAQVRGAFDTLRTRESRPSANAYATADKPPKGTESSVTEPRLVFEPGEEPGVPWNLRIDSEDPVPVELSQLFALPALAASFDLFVLMQSEAAPAENLSGSRATPRPDVLIARDGETIVTQDIEDLIRIEAAVGNSGFLSSFFSGSVKDEDADGSKASDNPPTWEDAQKHPLAVVYQGTSFDLFCQPVSIVTERPGTPSASTSEPGNGAAENVLFVAVRGVQICGLVSSAALATEAWSVPNPMMIAAFLLILATVIAWPALKLRLMAREELLEIGDVRLLLLSGVLGVGLLTFVIAVWMARSQFEHVLDEDARQFASDLESALTRELCQVDAALDNVPFGECSKSPDETCLDIPAGTYDRITDVALLNQHGDVTGLCVRDKPTIFRAAEGPPQPLSYRQYFRDVVAGRTTRLSCSHHDVDVAVESIRTRTTGMQTVAVARKLGDSVLVGSARTASVIEPVLPPGLGFAVIDAQGRVQLHSDPSRNLEENFLEDCEQAAVIRSAMAAHRTIVLDATYRDQPHRVLVHPFSDLPWTLLAFRDHVDEDEMLGLIALRSLTLFGLYFVTFPLLLAALSAFWPRSRASWLWLDDARVEKYRAACVPLVALVPVCIAGLYSEGASSVYLLLYGVPLTAVGVLFMTLASGKAANSIRTSIPFFIGVVCVSFAVWQQASFLLFTLLPLLLAAAWSVIAHTRRTQAPAVAITGPTTAKSLHRSYVAMLTLVLLGTAAFPAALVFRDAHALTAEQFVKRGQVRYLEALAHHADEQKRNGWNITAPTPKSDGVYSAGLFGTPDKAEPVPPADGKSPFGSAASDCSTSHGESSPPRHLCALVVGVLESYFPSLQLMAKDRAADADWCWSGKTPLTMDVTGSGLGSQLATALPSLRLVGDVDRLRDLHTRGMVVAGIAGTLVVLLVFGLIGWVVKRLFVVGENDPWLENTDAPGAARVWLYVDGQNNIDLETLLALPATRVDLQSIDRAAPSKAFPESVPTGTVLVIDHLEAHLASKSWSTMLLPILERFVFSEPPLAEPIVIVSEIDALWYLSQGFGDSEPDAEDTDAVAVVGQFRRWSQLIGACRGMHLPIPAAQPGANPRTLGCILASKREMLPEFGRAISEEASWRIWSHSNKAEKLAMTQLAREGFMNPNNREVISRLMVRGLIYRTPAFRFFHRNFASFVARAEPIDDIRQWETADAAGSWARLRRVLVGALVAVVGFFMLTQDDAYRTFMALLAAVTTAVPAILAFGKLFTRDRDTQHGNG